MQGPKPLDIGLPTYGTHHASRYRDGVMTKKVKAMFFNGSPRKNKNTADMLQSAMHGAEAAGAETELIHLYDIDFKGCKSCFACKLSLRTADKTKEHVDGVYRPSKRGACQ